MDLARSCAANPAPPFATSQRCHNRRDPRLRVSGRDASELCRQHRAAASAIGTEASIANACDRCDRRNTRSICSDGELKQGASPRRQMSRRRTLRICAASSSSPNVGDAVIHPGIQRGDDSLRVLARQQADQWRQRPGLDHLSLRTRVRRGEVQQHGGTIPRSGRARVDLGDEDFTLANSAIKTLTAQDTYLDFYYASQVPCFGV